MKYTIIEKAKAAGLIFKSGFSAQMKDIDTYALAGSCGVWQGLKYKGSLKTGLITTAIVGVSWGTLNGIREVVKESRLIGETQRVEKNRIYRIKKRA